MHDNNRKWLTDLRRDYPEHFHKARVLEIGSRIWGDPPNDTIRPFFTECAYLGVDKVNGPGVDLCIDHIDLLDDYSVLGDLDDARVDTLAIFSVFEHDPVWRETLAVARRWLRPGGLLVTCFGAEGNLPHLMNWKPVPHQEFLSCCKDLGLDVLDAFFEEDRYGPNCAGCYNVVAREFLP